MCFHITPFYVFHTKTVRSPSQNRTVSVRRTYGFGTENIKGNVLMRQTQPITNNMQ